MQDNYDREKIIIRGLAKSSPGIGPECVRCDWELTWLHRELAKGIGSLLGWCKEVHWKKTKTYRKIVGVAKKLVRSWEGHKGLIFTQRRLIVEAGGPRGRGLGSGRRPG
ncbi:hypothetical protein BHE74_00058340 [Ensete ventricosum]|nr:hypothetical protein BHE74_00058340 [Ensete ventricosum]